MPTVLEGRHEASGGETQLEHTLTHAARLSVLLQQSPRHPAHPTHRVQDLRPPGTDHLRLPGASYALPIRLWRRRRPRPVDHGPGTQPDLARWTAAPCGQIIHAVRRASIRRLRHRRRTYPLHMLRVLVRPRLPTRGVTRATPRRRRSSHPAHLGGPRRPPRPVAGLVATAVSRPG